MLWTNTEYLADASDDNVNEVGHPSLTFIHTSHFEVDANPSQISLTNDDYIQYVTVDDNAKDSSEAEHAEAAETGEPTGTPKKAEVDKPKGNTKGGGSSHSDDQDDGMFSDGEGEQPSNSAGFQGWSDDEAEGDEPTDMANIVKCLEEDQHGSGVGMGSDWPKLNIMGIVSEGQVMVDMATHSKDHSSTGRKQYDTLKTLSGVTLGKSGASSLLVMEVFTAPMTKEIFTPNNVNGYYSQVMTGLAGLFTYNAICKITTSDTGNEKKTLSKCYCPLCIYLVGNHMTMNNHIHYYLQLALVCHLKHCFYVDTQAKGMWKHVEEKHNMARGESATGKR